MSFEVFIKFFIIGVFILSIAVAGILIIATSIYDIGIINLQRKIRRHPKARYLRDRPVVSVVVYAGKQHAATVGQTLTSIAASSYRKLEVIVIDPGKYARDVVAAMRKQHPKLRLIHTASEKQFRRYVSAELVLHIDGNVALAKSGIKDAQQFMAADARLNSIKVSSRPLAFPSFRNVINRFQWLNLQPYNKLRCMLKTNPDKFMVILGVLQCIAITYLLYLAVYLKTPQFYLLSWGLACGWLVLQLLLNDTLSRVDALRLSVYIPLMYNIFYVMGMVQLITFASKRVFYVIATVSKIVFRNLLNTNLLRRRVQPRQV